MKMRIVSILLVLSASQLSFADVSVYTGAARLSCTIDDPLSVTPKVILFSFAKPNARAKDIQVKANIFLWRANISKNVLFSKSSRLALSFDNTSLPLSAQSDLGRSGMVSIDIRNAKSGEAIVTSTLFDSEYHYPAGAPANCIYMTDIKDKPALTGSN